MERTRWIGAALAHVGALVLAGGVASAQEAPKPKAGVIEEAAIEDFAENPEPVRDLLRDALELAARGLGYAYGSADPERGGMDCSGAVYYLIREQGITDVPRSSHLIYRWAWENGRINPVTSGRFGSFEFGQLKPGDLLFWTGTYSVDRDPPITHVMIYLGIEEETGEPLMVGASNGRTFHGAARHGVGVFDFRLPRPSKEAGRRPRFVGYGRIPGLGE